MDRFDCDWNNFLLFLVLMSNIVEFSIKYYLLVTINIVIEYIYWAVKGNIPKIKKKKILCRNLRFWLPS
jgi:hypothetical protein